MNRNPDNDSHSTTPAHTIRLRGPCKLLWLRNGTQQAEVRVHIPCNISPDLFELSADSEDDTFVLQRNFRQPTGLEPAQNVMLDLSGFENADRVVINRDSDEEIAVAYDAEEVTFDVTKALRKQNRFEVEFNTLPSHAGEAQLRIQ